jgi:hypothetical protein
LHAGWPDSANFRPFTFSTVYFGQFLKLWKQTKFLGNFFDGSGYASILTKKWLGYISGVFFTISSGHPVCAELFTYLLTVQASLRGQVQKPFFKERSFCKVKIICSNRIG